MTNSRFIYSILAAFIAGMLLLIFIQYQSSRSIDHLIEGNRLLLNEMKVGNDLRETERNIISVESKIRGAVATGDSAFLQGIDELIAGAEANLDTLRQLAADTATRADVDKLAVLARLKRTNKNLMLDSFFHRGRKPDRTMMANPQGQGSGSEINSIIRRLYAKRKDRLAALNDETTKYGRIARTSGIVLISLVLLSGCGLFWLIVDRMRKQYSLIRRLDASERQLQDAVRIKENFLANMSHEIRTPLNSIIGFARLLARQPLDKDSQEFTSAIGQAGENLLVIINDILDLSKIEAGMMRINAQPFAVRQLFHSLETLFQHRLKEKGLTLSTIVGEEVPETLKGDATRLTQILVNLVANGLKFTDKGGVEMRVSAGRAVGGEGGGTADMQGTDADDAQVQLCIEVADTGIGISREQITAIFERFSQAEDSMTRKYGGTGLGLSIVKELIELQNGTIEVESEPGKGTRFRFFIPYDIVKDVATLPEIPVSKLAAMPRMKDVCILVADDNRMNQRLMEHLLGKAGITFTVVDDGRKVIDQLREKHYHLVLMDIQMPVMDGYTSSRQIREDLRSSIPIIAMTAHAMPGEREKCIAAGMNEYLSKPIDADELFTMIGRFVEEGCAPDGREEEPAIVGMEVVTPAKKGEYRFIDMAYLRELSGGDREYEIEMSEQFLQAVPAELGQLETALAAGDRTSVSQMAHNLKTTVSIMGLSERLYILLDLLEYPDGAEDIAVVYETLRQVLEIAMAETRRSLAERRAG